MMPLATGSYPAAHVSEVPYNYSPYSSTPQAPYTPPPPIVPAPHVSAPPRQGGFASFAAMGPTAPSTGHTAPFTPPPRAASTQYTGPDDYGGLSLDEMQSQL